jgi:hypothetical protein
LDDDDERAICIANPSVPVECWKDNAAYDVFNALADRNYINPAEQKLKVAKIALPLSSYNADLQFAMHEKLLPQHKIQNKGLTVIAYDTSNKFKVFTTQLKVDAR